MASGNTIGGSIRVIKEDTEGNRNTVFGDVSSGAVDGKNGSLSPSEKIYINTSKTNKVAAPLQAKEYTAENARFQPGEKLIVQHISSSVEEAADPDAANAFAIDVLKQDRNTGRIYPRTLSEADNEVTGTPSTDTDDYVDIFQETVPDRNEFRLAGSFEAGAYENA